MTIKIRNHWFAVLAGIYFVSNGYSEEIEGAVLPFKSVTVSSPVLEIIREIPVNEGDAVEKTDVLAQLENEQETLELERYAKLVEQAKYESDAAERLFKSGSGTESDAIQSKTEYDKLISEQALVELRFKQKTVRAPIDGIVVDKLIEAGESVDRVEPMFEIVNIDQVFLRFYVAGEYLRVLKKGAALKVKYPLLGDDKEYTATVDFIDSRIDPGSGLVEIKLLAQNPDHEILAGMRAIVVMPELETK